MECLRCNKIIKTPNELFNGTLVCPNCQNKLFDVNDDNRFDSESVESREYFELAEGFYLNALSLASKANPKLDDEINDLFKACLEYCRKALYNNRNPYACYRLATLYDYDFIDKDKTELERSKIAAKLYYSLCKSNDVNDNLKNMAKESLLTMFYENGYKDYYELYNNKLNEIGLSNTMAKTLVNHTDMVNQIVSEVFNSAKPPVISFIKVTLAEMAKIDLKSVAFNLFIIPIDTDDRIINYKEEIVYDGNLIPGSFVSLNNERIDAIMKKLNEKNKNNKYLLYLFNNKAKSARKVTEQFTNPNNLINTINSLGNRLPSVVTLHDSDINYYFDKRNNDVMINLFNDIDKLNM